MAKSLNLKELIDKNPKVNLSDLSDALEAVIQLRQGGISAPDYSLGSPFARRAAPAENPPHSVRLTRDK